MINKISFLCFLLSAALLMASCENDSKQIEALTKKVILKDEAKNITSYLSQGGKMRARLTAPLMWRVETDSFYIEFPKSLHVDFFDSLKIIETRLDAKYGKYYETQNKIYLRDSVLIKTNTGATLLCEDLWFDQNKDKFYTDKKVIYNDSLAGISNYIGEKGLDATKDFKDVRFKASSGNVVIRDTASFP